MSQIQSESTYPSVQSLCSTAFSENSYRLSTIGLSKPVLPPEDLSATVFPTKFELPTLEGLKFEELVNDVQINSRLPALGQDFEIAFEDFGFTDRFQQIPLSHADASVPMFSEIFVAKRKYGSSRGLTKDLHLDLGSRSDTNYLLSKATSCEIIRSTQPETKNENGINIILDEEHREKMERILVSDLLLIFHGCNGTILQFSKDNYFAFYTDEKNLHPAQKTIALRLCPIGVCYKFIKSQLYIPVRGKCFEAFRHWFQEQLREFDLMVLTLEQQMLGRANDEELEKYRKIVPFGSDAITLHQLECLFYDSKKSLKAMSSMLTHVKPSISGGRLCSLLHDFTNHGDPDIQDFAFRTLAYVAKPIYKMIGSWIFLGNVHDKYGEFFVKTDESCNPKNMWRQKFTLKKDEIPSFISRSEAAKIYGAGKNLNFLLHLSQAADPFPDKSRLFRLYKSIDVEGALRYSDSLFSDLINTACTVTSDRVLKEIVENEKLLENLHTIKHYLLQGQGDFFQSFIHNARNQLIKPVQSVNVQEMQETLQLLITRATHVASKDYLSKVYVTIGPRSETLSVWDVFSLEYSTSFCLQQVITSECMQVYSRVFSFLWQALRVESVLKTMWVERKMFSTKVLSSLPEIHLTAFMNNVLISEFNNFVTQVRYYAMSEAVETEWHALLDQLNEITCLEDIITAHEKFVMVLNVRCLQNKSARNILLLLESVYNNIFKMEKYYKEFCHRVSREIQRRNEMSSEIDAAMNQLQRLDFVEYLQEAETNVKILQTTSRELIQEFLLAAESYIDNAYGSISLTGLCFRVDFNNFYTDRNSRLKDAKTLKYRLSEMNMPPVYASKHDTDTCSQLDFNCNDELSL